ncbi:MAG TPA: hypothetical protein PKK76_17365 [Leptospiraceae bacterium]|nr:hypothetical protein [Leptospiraceae bacterium]HQI20140.1 hypothetical protein [Leptospiraceae bacterium]
MLKIGNGLGILPDDVLELLYIWPIRVFQDQAEWSLYAENLAFASRHDSDRHIPSPGLHRLTSDSGPGVHKTKS